MADTQLSTDTKSQDTRPEVPRLLLEGQTTISSFSAVTGGYLGSRSIDITKINDIGNTNKVFADSGSYKVEVFHTITATSEFDLFRPVPYQTYYNPLTGVYDFTGQVRRWARFEVRNQHVLVGDIYASTLTIYYFASTNNNTDYDDAGNTQRFVYKIWSVPFTYET